MTHELLQRISEASATGLLPRLLRAAAWLLIGVPAVLAASRRMNRHFAKKVSKQHGLIAGKLVLLAGLTLIVVSVFYELGFQLGPLLGTAGVVGVAVGFAAQTSLSNLVSGLFLIGERHFQVGDTLTVGDTTGEVLSIDLMSVKLRTFDNKYVRIPNETIVKSEVTNVTYFPIRRVDLAIGVAYKEDIGRVRAVLLDVAARNPLCLMEPEPLIILQGFGASSVNLMLAAWAEKSDWLTVKNTLLEEIKTRFDSEGIEIPFPHVSLYAGSATEPLPVRLVREREGEKAS
jgi:small-conductance mechanosensitive channel